MEQLRFFRSFDAQKLAYRVFLSSDQNQENQSQQQNASSRLNVLCLSGIARSSLDFVDLAKLLSAHHCKVVCLDYRGRGLSEWSSNPMQSYLPKTYLEDIRHLCICERLENILIVGTSLGGILAMGMATYMPSLLSGIILNDVGAKISLSAVEKIRNYISERHVHRTKNEGIKLLKSMIPNDYYDHESCWHKLHQNTFNGNEQQGYFAHWDPAIAKPLQNKIDLSDLSVLFKAIKPFPTLAVRGEHSRLLTKEYFCEMISLKPDLERIEIKGRGHTPFLDEPAFIDAVIPFIKTLRNKG
ncbi:MAG: alpha/beta hydrolase [Pseudomonadota bacterium]